MTPTAVEGRIAVVLGTRPEIIKMAEIVALLGDRAMLIHTGQHWDATMSGAFMAGLGLPAPAASLTIGGSTRAQQIASCLSGLEGILQSDRPAAVMVQGDTNSALGGAMAANSLEIPLVHVEAGLRSFDRAMPEEHNRVVIDHLADLCLAPTEGNRDLLLAEGIAPERVVVTGNTVIGAVTRALSSGAGDAEAILEREGLSGDDYVLATIHRPENTDDRDTLGRILHSFAVVAQSVAPVILPLHPRTRRRILDLGLIDLLSSLRALDPLDYDTFVALSSRAAITISDSGGVQEVASVWQRPVIVLRRSTERPEGLGRVSFMCPPGTDLPALARQVFHQRNAVSADLAGSPSPYGDLHAARRCVDAVTAMVRGGREGHRSDTGAVAGDPQ